MSDPGPEEPALNAQHGNDAYSYCIKRVKHQNGDISNNIKIAKVPKMTDVRAEAAHDAEHVDPKIVFLEWLTEACRRQGCPPGLASFFNNGSLPEEKKVTKTPVKKRKYKPKRTPKIEALEKKENKQKSKLKETKKKLQTEKLTAREKIISDRIEKDKNRLVTVWESMEKQNIEIDKKKKRVATMSTEIDKIKNNINQINEKKDSIDREIKELKEKEARAKTEIQEMEHEKDRIDREIQNIKDKYAKEESNRLNNIEAKKNTLAIIKEQCEKNNQRNKKEYADTMAQIDAKIKKIKDDELKKEKKLDSIIAAKNTAYVEMKKDLQKKERIKQEMITYLDSKFQKMKHVQEVEIRKMEKVYEKRKPEYEKQIRDMQLNKAERKRAINAEFKHFEENVAQLKENIDIMENGFTKIKQEYKNEIRVLKLLKAEKQIKFEADIQTLEESDDQARIDLQENTKAWRYSLDTDLVEQNNAERQRKKSQRAAMKNEERKYREEIDTLHKKLALNEETLTFGGTSSVRYTRELPRDLHFSRPSTSSDIVMINLTHEDTDLPSNSANNTASSSHCLGSGNDLVLTRIEKYLESAGY